MNASNVSKGDLHVAPLAMKFDKIVGHEKGANVLVSQEGPTAPFIWRAAVPNLLKELLLHLLLVPVKRDRLLTNLSVLEVTVTSEREGWLRGHSSLTTI